MSILISLNTSNTRRRATRKEHKILMREKFLQSIKYEISRAVSFLYCSKKNKQKIYIIGKENSCY